MTLKIIDIHAHVNFPQFDADRVAVIERARAAGVGMINVGTDLETSRGAVALAEANDDMWATVGIHPADSGESASRVALAEWDELERLARLGRVVAIGECGLDFKSEKLKVESYKEQAPIFERQIELAQRVGKPLMLHVRNAYAEVLDILTFNFKLSTSHPGNVHFFAGDWATAKQFLDLNFTLSFTGVLTFAKDYDEVVKNTPLDRIMVETDCPFVAPAPYRGKRNEPSYLPAIIQRMAEIKGLSVEEVSQVTLANSQRVFGLALS